MVTRIEAGLHFRSPLLLCSGRNGPFEVLPFVEKAIRSAMPRVVIHGDTGQGHSFYDRLTCGISKSKAVPRIRRIPHVAQPLPRGSLLSYNI